MKLSQNRFTNKENKKFRRERRCVSLANGSAHHLISTSGVTASPRQGHKVGLVIETQLPLSLCSFLYWVIEKHPSSDSPAVHSIPSRLRHAHECFGGTCKYNFYPSVQYLHFSLNDSVLWIHWLDLTMPSKWNENNRVVNASWYCQKYAYL